MLADNINTNIMQTDLGETVGEVAIKIDGDWYSVLPVPAVALNMGMSERQVQRKCEEGQLIARKIFSRWWVVHNQLSLRRKNVRHRHR